MTLVNDCFCRLTRCFEKPTSKRRAIACVEHGLAAVLDQRQLAPEDVDELVLMRVPMALA